jgi:hypothetical protein
MENEFAEGVHLADDDGHIQVATLCRLLPQGYISLSIILLYQPKKYKKN